MTIPTLETERLILSAMVLADWPAYRDVMATDHAKFLDGPYDAPSCWGMFCADHAGWDLRGYGALMIHHKGTGECLGQVGVNASPFFPEPDLGWFLYPQHQGQGFASEAARALKDWAAKSPKVKSLVSYMSPDNPRSIAVAERIEGKLDPTTKPTFESGLVYRHF